MTESYFASGTGAAGLVGAFLWWELRNLGVKTGVGISAVRHSVERRPSTFTKRPINVKMLPFVIPITFFFILPKPDAFSSLSLALHPDIIVSSPSEYTALPSNDPSNENEQEEDDDETDETVVAVSPTNQSDHRSEPQVRLNQFDKENVY